MQWYSIVSPDIDTSNEIFNKLHGMTIVVRESHTPGTIYVCVGNLHRQLLLDMCHTGHATATEMDDAPAGVRSPKHEAYTMLCGVIVYDPEVARIHSKGCAKCQKIKSERTGVPPAYNPSGENNTGHHSTSRVIAKINPGSDHDIQGCIESLKSIQADMLENTSLINRLIPMLDEWQKDWDNLVKLHDDVVLRVNAIKMLMHEGRYTAPVIK